MSLTTLRLFRLIQHVDVLMFFNQIFLWCVLFGLHDSRVSMGILKTTHHWNYNPTRDRSMHHKVTAQIMCSQPVWPRNPPSRFFLPKDGHTRCKSAVHNLHLALDHPRENGLKDLDCLTESTVGEVVSNHELEASSWRNVWHKHPSSLQETRTSKQTKKCLWKNGHLPNLHLCGRNTVKLIPTGAMNRAILCTMNISNFCSLWPLSHQFHQDMTGCGTSPAMPGIQG